MVDAQVAAEDQSFWNNPCVDLRSIVRAFLQNFQAGETVSGASTICQQLVRMRLFSADLMADPDRQVERKIKEAILALRLDGRYSGDEGKQRILEMYMNQSYYGNNAYGIWAAATAYFGKDLTSDAPEDQLTVSEAAMLAGLVRAPSRLDPSTEAVQEERRRRDRLRGPADGTGDRRARLRARPDARVGLHHPGAARRGGRRGDRPGPAAGTTATSRRTSCTPCDARRTSCSRERTCSTPAVCGSTPPSTTRATSASRRSGRGIGYDMDRLSDERAGREVRRGRRWPGSSSSRAATSTTTPS